MCRSSHDVSKTFQTQPVKRPTSVGPLKVEEGTHHKANEFERKQP